MAAEDSKDEISMGQMEEEARKRKERLRALRQKLEGGDAESSEKQNAVKPLPKPVFRSYKPQDETLQNLAKPKVVPIDIEAHVAETIQQGEIKTLLEDVDLMNLAPRKPDWDLKRDIAPKLLKLERRTQKAIAELIFDRLKSTQDLAAAVQANPRTAQDDED